MIHKSVLSCMHCNHTESHTLEENITPSSYRCENCQQQIKIKPGECCIYCVFADYPCLQAQIIGSSCCDG